MKTRDPDHPGAHKLSPIKPGTLCLTVTGRATSWPDPLLGKTLTAGHRDGPCFCGEDLYMVSADWLPPGWHLAHRSTLQPLLPPGIDDQVERAIGNPQLEVV